MAFIAGKGFAILNSKAEKGDAKAKELLSKLDSIDQDEADRLFSEILGKKGGGGSKKEKKIKAPGASATEGQGEITEGAGEQAPTGKATPKSNEQAYQEALAKVAAEKNPRKKEIAKNKLITGHDKKIDQIEKDLEGFNAAEPKGEVRPKGLIGPGMPLPRKKGEKAKLTLPELLDGEGFEAVKQLQESGIAWNEISQKANELQEAGVDKKQFASEILKLKKNQQAPAADPLDEANLETLFKKYKGNEDKVLDDLRSQLAGAESDPENPLSNGDLQGIVEAYAIRRGSTKPVLPGKNKPAKKVKLSSDAKDLIDDAVYRFEYEKKELGQDEFKAEATSTWGLSEEEADAAYQRYVDKAKINTSPKLKQEKTKGTSVEEVVKRNIENDIEPSFTQIAQEFGISPEEVLDIYNNQLEQNDAAVEIDTAGANPAPAGAFGDIEPETQQLAGIQSKEPIGEELVDEDTIGIVSRDYNPQVPRDGGLYKSGISTWQAEGKNGGAILNEEEDGSFSVTQFDKDKNEFSTLFYDDFETAKQYARAATMQDAKTRKGPESLQDFIKEDEDFAKEFAQLDEQGNELPTKKQVPQDVINRIENPNETDAEIYNAITDEIRMTLFGGADFDENDVQFFANEYGITEDEVRALADREKKTYTPRAEQQNLTPDEQDRIDFELETSAEESKTKPITNADVQRLVELTGGTKEQVTQALDQKGANFSSEVQIFQPDSGLQKVYADPRQQIDDIMQTGRGGVSEQEAQQIAAEFGISVDEVRKLERQSQSEIAFPAPDGEPIPADQDFDEQGNPIGNINDKEVADELGVDEQQLGELLGPNPTYNKRTAPWEPENIKEILAQTGGDKAKALELLKQQQSQYKGPRLENKFLPGIIDQVAAGETNPSLPASEPTAEQLAETNVLFEDTAETSAAEPAQELNKLQGLLPLSLKEAGIDESTPTAERGPKYRELINQLSNLEKKRPDLSKEINVLFEKLSSELDQVIAGNNAGEKPAQASAQIKQTAQANAQAAGVQQQPQSQQPAAGKTDRKKVEAAAVELGINADLLEGLLELIKRVK